MPRETVVMCHCRPRSRGRGIPARTFLALAIGLLSGCGPKVNDVSGTVTYQNKVVTSGMVTMVGVDGVPMQAEIKEDGSYLLKGVGVGEVKVVVSSPPLAAQKGAKKVGRIDPDTGKPMVSKGTEVADNVTQHQKDTWRAIPIRYSDITQTNLRYTVTAGPSNTHEIKLD